MFTGIIEHVGTIARTQSRPGGRRLCIDAGSLVDKCGLGDSICVSGVCLTVAVIDPPFVEFDVIQETLSKTAVGSLGVGDSVNLERSLAGDGRIHGHFVQGHVDGVATVTGVIASAKEHVVSLRAPETLRRYLIPKGSVALDGVSLTIASLQGDVFSVALIPTTLEQTTLGRLQSGSGINVETDMIVRTVVHQLSAMADGGGLTLESLQQAGFV